MGSDEGGRSGDCMYISRETNKITLTHTQKHTHQRSPRKPSRHLSCTLLYCTVLYVSVYVVSYSSLPVNCEWLCRAAAAKSTADSTFPLFLGLRDNKHGENCHPPPTRRSVRMRRASGDVGPYVCMYLVLADVGCGMEKLALPS